MARRTATFIQAPWAGGVNTSTDPGMIPSTDLVKAENVVFSATGARIKRENFTYLDATMPASVSRASSGTTRTLVFAAAVDDGSDQKLVVGEQVTIAGAGGASAASYNQDVYIKSISDDGLTVTYIATGSVSEGTTADTGITVTRKSAYVEVAEYWRTDASYVKQQRIMAFSTQGKLFSYNLDGDRTEIISPPEVFTVIATAQATKPLANSDWFKIYDKDGLVGVYISIDTPGAGTPPGGTTRNLEVIIDTGAAATANAGRIKDVIDADSQFSATVNSATVTVTNRYMGTRTATADGTQATGFTFATTTEGTGSVTAGFTSITSASSAVLNERFILAMSGTGNTPIYYHPETHLTHYYVLQNTGPTPDTAAPDASFMKEHMGRLWMNDKTDPDLLHYSAPGDPETWVGWGDSGGILIAPGDGDPRGISAIFPPLKDRLFIAKGSKVYQISGYEPESFQVQPLTSGVGCEGHKTAVSVDSEDVVFVSKRGIHSLAATDAYGDFSGSFLSAKIQPTFNEWPQTALDLSSAAYVPSLNSVAFAVAEEGDSSPGAIWLYNIAAKEWYTWPAVDPRCMNTYLDSGEVRRLLWGTSNSQIILSQSGDFTDFSTTAIRYAIKSGRIYPDSNPHSYKGFKKLGFIFRPRGRYSFTVRYKIDNLPMGSLSFADSIRGDELGTAFVLGQSVLGNSQVLSPTLLPIAGHGRGIEIEITNENSEEQVEIYGLVIEYELEDIMQGVNPGS